MKEHIKAIQDAAEMVDFYMDEYEKARVSLCSHIREAREKTGMKAVRFAEKVGVSAPYLYDIELGRRFPSEKTLAKIITALS